MRGETLWKVWWWGVGLTAFAVPIVAAALGTNLVIIPLVVLGAGTVVARMFWPSVLFRTFVLPLIEEPSSKATNITYLICGIMGNIILAFWIVVIPVHWHRQPCFCGDVRSLLFLITLALTALVLAFWASAAFLTTVFAIYRLNYNYRAKRQ